MQLRVAERKQVKMRLGLSGASGFGKTYSALLLAFGLTGDWSKIALTDTENGSGELYSHLGPYNVLTLTAPFAPERYIEALHACEKAGMEAIIIDSVSHEWEGKGGCLEIVEGLGGRYQDWAKVTPRHQAFLSAILNSSCHVITTVRRKQDYDMVKNDKGKMEVQKVGTKEVTREGFEYELTCSLELINDKHLAKASKDRTGLFMNQPEFVITSETGKKILEWCNSGKAVDMEEIKARLEKCGTPDEVKMLWETYPELRKNAEAKELFIQRGEELKVNEVFQRTVNKNLQPLKEDMREAAEN